MRVIQAEAARLGYRKLIGRVLADNNDSLRLCEATGWRTVGTHAQHARLRDRGRAADLYFGIRVRGVRARLAASGIFLCWRGISRRRGKDYGAGKVCGQ